jgi:hypothetical protein
LNPVLSISSPGFQKSSPGFVKHESGFFSSPGPGVSRVRIFFESVSGSESESGPGFEVCRPHVMTFSIAGSLVMIGTNLEQFLSQSLVASYIFITRNYNT